MKEITGLSFEQNKKYGFAIKSGLFDDYETDPRGWKHTLVGAFIWKHKDRVKVIRLLEEIVGHIPTWDDMTDEVLCDFVDEMKDSELAISSVKTICAELKAVLNRNNERIPSSRYMSILSIRGETSQAVYLTWAEIDKILGYKVQSSLEHFVHHCFCVELLTGARLADAEKMTVSNCDIDTNMLSYVPNKTPNIVVNVPVDEKRNLRRILADRPKRGCSKDVFNETVRRICKELNIDTLCTINKAGRTMTEPKYKFVSSHTARRSFATNLYLAGISIEDIALMMGHGKNIETTKRYICAERSLSPSVMSYFQ